MSPRSILATMILALLVVTTSPALVYAQGTGAGGAAPGGGTGAGGPSAGSAGSFDNPLGSSAASNDISLFLVRIIKWLLGIVAFLAMLALIWGGIQYITALGSEQRVQTAKQTLTWAIIGLAIVTLSFAIVQLVQAVLTGT